MSIKTVMRRLQFVAGASVLALVIAQPAGAQAAASHLEIAAKPAGVALRELAEKTGSDILFTPEAVRGVQARPVNGRMTPADAARNMLAGARLEVVEDTGGAVIVRPRGQPAIRRSSARAVDGVGPLAMIQASTAQPLRYAAAQPDGPSAAAAPAAQPEPATVEDVVVTAQRRSERLQDVPIAVTALSSQSLTASGIRASEDLTQIVPGLDVGRSKQALAPYLRGVGVNDNSAGNENSVAFYVDGIYIAAPAAAFMSFNNIERVEVLKGPQGTLFGRNSTGGLIQVVTRDPSDTPGGQASVSYGNYSTWGGNFYGTTRVNESAAADLSLTYERRDKGFGHNLVTGREVNDREEFAARTKWLIDNGGPTQIRIAADYVYNNAPLVRQVLRSSTLNTGYRFTGGEQDVALNLDPWNHTTQYGGYITVNHDLGWAQAVSRTAQRRTRTGFINDQDASPAALVDALIKQNSRSFSQELQLLSPEESRIKWIVGGYYSTERAAYAPLHIIGAAITPLTFRDINDDQTTKSIAGFGQVVVPLGDLTNITLGARYTRDERTLNGTVSTNLATTRIPTRTAKSSKPNFRAAVDHKFTPDVLGYVSFTRGFKSGLFNLTDPTAPPINPEQLDAYEVGFKSTLLDRRLILNASTFYYDYKDIQVQVRPTGGVFLLNAAGAEIYGADVEFNARANEYLTLRGGVSWLHATYSDFRNGPIATPRATGGNILANADLTGNRMVRAPKFTANLAADVRVPVSNGELGANVSVYHNGGFVWEPDNRLRQPSYQLVNANFSWTSLDERLRVELFAKNLFNELYFQEAGSNAFGDNGTPAPPRLYGVRLGTKF